MEERILKKTAIFLMLLSLGICCGISYFPQLGAASKQFVTAIRDYQTKTQAERLNLTGLDLLAYNNEKALEAEDGAKSSFSSQLRLELPLGVSGEDLIVTQEYMTRKIMIQIPFANEEYVYAYPMLGQSDHIESLTYESFNGYGQLTFLMDMVYETQIDYDKEYYYIDFLRPKDIYDKVVVIDAGHGGDALGTVKQGIYEKDLNLAIVLQLKELLDADEENAIGVYYTRTEDENPSEENRENLMHTTGADICISVHNNSTQSGRISSIRGTQVMYAAAKEETAAEDNQNEGQAVTSKGLAQICLEEVTKALESADKGLVEDSENTFLQNRQTATVWIAVGFMTNEEELKHLQSKEYQKKAALGIYHAMLRAFAEGY